MGPRLFYYSGACVCVCVCVCACSDIQEFPSSSSAPTTFTQRIRALSFWSGPSATSGSQRAQDGSLRRMYIDVVLRVVQLVRAMHHDLAGSTKHCCSGAALGRSCEKIALPRFVDRKGTWAGLNAGGRGRDSSHQSGQARRDQIFFPQALRKHTVPQDDADTKPHRA